MKRYIFCKSYLSHDWAEFPYWSDFAVSFLRRRLTPAPYGRLTLVSSMPAPVLFGQRTGWEARRASHPHSAGFVAASRTLPVQPLSQPHKLQELGTVAEGIITARLPGDPLDLAIAEAYDMAGPAQLLPEGGHCDGKAHVLGG